MTKASIKTYKDKDNIIARLSHKETIFKLFNDTNRSYTIREVAKSLKWDYTRVQKRITDLVSSSLLNVIGSKEENGQLNSVYSINRMPEMFRKKRVTKLDLLKQSMRKCLDSGTYDAVIDEFNRMKG